MIKRVTLIFIIFLTVLVFTYSQDNTAFLDSITSRRINLQFDEALSEINAAIDRNPENGDYYATRSFIYNDMKEYQEVINDITIAITLGSNFNLNILYTIRGFAYFQLGRFNEALIDMSKEDINNVVIIRMRADLNLRLRNHEKAVEDYSYLLENDNDARNHKYYYFSRAEAFFENKNYSEALDDINNNAITHNSRDARYYTLRGCIYLGLKLLDKVIDDLNRALQLEPADNLYATIYLSRSIAYAWQGKFTLSLADINMAIENNPNKASCFIARAQLYEVLAATSLRRSVKKEYLRRSTRDYTIAERLRNSG